VPILIIFAIATIARAQDSRRWFERPQEPRRPTTNPHAKSLPLIRVDGNRFVDPDGKTILFRGVSIADPDVLEHQDHWNRRLFEEVKKLGANIVRLPVHPVAWRERSPEKYLALLDQAVQWCTELEMYVIIDWHSIGNLKMELFQNPMYDTTLGETNNFWRTIARHFRGHNTVAFYEIFNEPTDFRGQLGRISWSDWKQINEDIIHLIRAFDNETIPLVAGFDWAYDLTPLHTDPINAERIGYVTHPYPFKRSRPWEPKWEENFGFAAGKYPIVATELGFGERHEVGDGGDKIDDDHYGNRITRYLEGKGISWVAWCYDPSWGPTMLKNWDFDLTASGEFFKQAMHREPAMKK
jgi:aryl-phospho-beta-D-glucosidase BglC (GH1 family)